MGLGQLLSSDRRQRDRVRPDAGEVSAITALATRPTRRPATTKLALIDIVIPVYNEAIDLERSVRTLDAYLSVALPYSYRVTIADNASKDGTWLIAQGLASTMPHVTAVHLDQKGRAGAEEGVHQPLLQPRPAHRAAGVVLGRAVRVQGDAPRRGASP